LTPTPLWESGRQAAAVFNVIGLFSLLTLSVLALSTLSIQKNVTGTWRLSRTRATCSRTLQRPGSPRTSSLRPPSSCSRPTSGHPGLGKPANGRLHEGELLGRVAVLVREQDLSDGSVEHDHYRYGHHPDRHRTGGLADHRFFRRRIRDSPLLDDAPRAQSASVAE
jgi:hypothetical protein